MNAILKFDFQKIKQLRFSEVNYLDYTKRPNFACDNYIFPKTRETRTNSVPIPQRLNISLTVWGVMSHLNGFEILILFYMLHSWLY